MYTGNLENEFVTRSLFIVGSVCCKQTSLQGWSRDSCTKLDPTTFKHCDIKTWVSRGFIRACIAACKHVNISGVFINLAV